jgi:NADPH-dependent 2,4-dienoyl-CoA reductase/sulfur reductase-like enzyme
VVRTPYGAPAPRAADSREPAAEPCHRATVATLAGHAQLASGDGPVIAARERSDRPSLAGVAESETDVVVVGAGSAGLTAAVRLRAAGLAVRVLESRCATAKLG